MTDLEKTMMDDVTVVVPAKDEREAIGSLLDELLRRGMDVLVVDGNSTDGTLDEVKKRSVRWIQDRGLGKGSALREAAREVKRRIIVFIDADGSHDVNDITRLLQPLREGQADMVVGSRITGGSDEAYGNLDFFLRTTGSHLITLAINKRWGVTLTDSQNGLRAVSRQAFLDLETTENITTIEQEMIMKALRKKMRILEIPTHEKKRQSGRSKIVLSRVWFRYVWSLLSNLLA
ncbi:MAG TPA: glycosyltransferase family 2 protein [Elusimicrobiota bacterium]|nr:glycosyltransferase family 2 protein [Elusimicrobiota bacterium]